MFKNILSAAFILATASALSLSDHDVQNYAETTAPKLTSDKKM